MMELNYLPDSSDSIGKRRIDLWRRAIFLFCKTEHEIGPFYQAGYEQYYCEGKSEEKLTPDIFGFSNRYFCICDVSISPQKEDEIQEYDNCKPSEYILSIFPSGTARTSTGGPFLITDVFNLTKPEGYNILQVIQPGEATLDNINDTTLKSILENWSGFISVPPSYQIMAVPESTPEELKRPMAAILKWTSSKKEGVSLEEAVQKLLGTLYTSFSKSSRARLRKNIEEIITDLSKGYLEGYLLYDKNEKRFSIQIDETNPISRKAFSERINQWLKIVPIERWTPHSTEDTEEDNDE